MELDLRSVGIHNFIVKLCSDLLRNKSEKVEFVLRFAIQDQPVNEM